MPSTQPATLPKVSRRTGLVGCIWRANNNADGVSGVNSIFEDDAAAAVTTVQGTSWCAWKGESRHLEQVDALGVQHPLGVVRVAVGRVGRGQDALGLADEHLADVWDALQRHLRNRAGQRAGQLSTHLARWVLVNRCCLGDANLSDNYCSRGSHT